METPEKMMAYTANLYCYLFKFYCKTDKNA
uniref:Uncharacterized protein n=1 Tax=Rhizophora mucronata TaxID=61149 RepID=A0A2P2J3T1_RHIMU